METGALRCDRDGVEHGQPAEGEIDGDVTGDDLDLPGLRCESDPGDSDAVLPGRHAEEAETALAIGAHLPIDALRVERDQRLLERPGGLVGHYASHAGNALRVEGAGQCAKCSNHERVFHRPVHWLAGALKDRRVTPALCSGSLAGSGNRAAGSGQRLMVTAPSKSVTAQGRTP